MDGWTIFFIVFFLLVILCIVVIIFVERMWKHKVIIREMTSGETKLIIETRAKEVNQDKVMWWVLKKEKDKIKKYMPCPPPEAIDITSKGKKFVEVYRTTEGEYIFITDSAKILDVPDEFRRRLEEKPQHIKDISNEDDLKIAYEKWKKEELAKYRKEHNLIATWNPLTKEQRMALVNSIKKAEMRKGVSWAEQLPMYINMGIIAILVIGILIFGPGLYETYTKGNMQIIAGATKYEEVRHQNLMEEMKQWNRIAEGITSIKQVQVEQARQIEQLKAENQGD